MQDEAQQIERVGLDCDGVLANFPQALIEKAAELGYADRFPAHWKDIDCWYIANGNCPDTFGLVWPHIKSDIDFWLKIKPLPFSGPLDFIPDCYITSRPVPSWVTEQWLALFHFPKAPVITVTDPKDKLVHALERKLDLFVDDHYETIEYMREHGVEAVLYSAPYQRGHAVDHLPTIKHLSEIATYSLT